MCIRDSRAGRHFDHVDNPHEGVSMNSDRWTPKQIFVYRHPVDMRKQIDGLANLVSSQLHRDPSDRSLYLFINRGRDKIKLLIWHLNGYWLLYKRLERQRFQ